MQITFKEERPLYFKGESNPTVIENFLFKVDWFAEKQHLGDREKLGFTIEHLEGDALAWFRLARGRWSAATTYEDFVRELKTRFYSQNYLDDAEYELTHLEQKADINAYARRFSELTNIVGPRLGENTLINHFVRGLKPKTKTAVLRVIHNNHSLSEVIAIAVQTASSLDRYLTVMLPRREISNNGYEKMDIDVLQTAKYPYGLNKDEYAYLKQHNGCFKCKQIGHRANRCKLDKRSKE